MRYGAKTTQKMKFYNNGIKYTVVTDLTTGAYTLYKEWRDWGGDEVYRDRKKKMGTYNDIVDCIAAVTGEIYGEEVVIIPKRFVHYDQ